MDPRAQEEVKLNDLQPRTRMSSCGEPFPWGTLGFVPGLCVQPEPQLGSSVSTGVLSA